MSIHVFLYLGLWILFVVFARVGFVTRNSFLEKAILFLIFPFLPFILRLVGHVLVFLAEYLEIAFYEVFGYFSIKAHPIFLTCQVYFY